MRYNIRTPKLTESNFDLLQFVPAKAGKKFKVYSPTTDEEVCEVHEALEEDVDLAVSAAEHAYRQWSELGANDRATPMFRLVELIQRDAEELAYLDSICMGKSVLFHSLDD